ncbi:MAG: DUF488 domain-containing protein [Butyrivibrio sp.]|nr:DUF488 domain-containing protein [Butyrivibrio sp.]
MDKIYTIGFTKKSAEQFFSLLKSNEVEVVIDVRLNNTSQLAGFSKYPDIKFFLNEICGIDYISDVNFSPEEKLLKEYKHKNITWEQYVDEFKRIMQRRDAIQYINENYTDYSDKKLCLLCSEDKAVNCHRLLVAELFQKVFGGDIVNL